jgi:IclR helix-turn-helix domain
VDVSHGACAREPQCAGESERHLAGESERHLAGEVFDAMGLAFDSTGIAAGAAEKHARWAGEQARGAFEMAFALLCREVEEAAGRERAWLGRVRAGLVAFLAFFDDEPERARRLLCGASSGDGVLALRYEQRVLGVLTTLMDDGSPQALAEISCDPQLTGELVSGGVLAMIRGRMGGEDPGSFVELAPVLMAFIVGPYLGEAAARAELSGRPAPRQEGLPDGEARLDGEGMRDVGERRGGGGLPLRVTRRTLLVLEAIARMPRASNREVARGAGVSDEGQTSRLLGRLLERGLVQNVGVGAVGGEPNAWLLTARGRRALELVGGARRAEAASQRARRMRGWA